MTWDWSYIYGPIILAPFVIVDVFLVYMLIQCVRGKPIRWVD